MTDHYLLNLTPERAGYLTVIMMSSTLLNTSEAVSPIDPLIRRTEKELALGWLALVSSIAAHQNKTTDKFLDDVAKFSATEFSRISDWMRTLVMYQALPPDKPSLDSDKTSRGTNND